MEVNAHKFVLKDEMKYQKAKKKARNIRDFYINLSLFCLFIPIIIGINLYFVPEFHWFWFSILGWGTGMLIHGLLAFEFYPVVIRKWEDRKIQQFIKEDLERENAHTNLKNQ